MPILLVNGKGSITSKQKEFLKGKNVQIYIAGGTSAISKQMEKSLRSYGTVVRRFAGNSRYETSRLIADTFFPKANSVVLTVGDNFPDGLSAGPVAAKLGAPILLTNNSSYKEAATYVRSHNIDNGIVIGGNGNKLISDDTVRKVFLSK
ncbi:MAG: cell wall-binding repeat-containing protein, partial [Bacillota bacterium]|nr:cell wall-binding repeat-containing protein [Bacillota bacterium]